MDQETEKPEPISWRVRPSDKAPAKRYGIVLIALAAGFIGAAYVRPLMGILTFAIILGSTADYWLGTEYKLEQDGASAKTGFSVTKIEWPNVKRVVVAEDGVKISPLPDSSRLSPFRGVFLRWGDKNPDEIVAAIRQLCKEDVRFVERGTE